MRFIATLGIVTLRTFSDAWALWILWGWFVAPLGVRSIGFWHAMGLDLTIAAVFALMMPRREEDDPEKDLWFAASKVILAPIFVGIGWVVLRGGI